MHQITTISKNLRANVCSALIHETRSGYQATLERYFNVIASLSNVTQLLRTPKGALKHQNSSSKR
jgi:hypothetical protein